MDISVMVFVLAALIIGAALGFAAAWAIMRERVRALESHARASGGDVEALAARAVQASSAQLLQLASERFERDSARREAVDAARSEQLARTLSPISETLSSLERSVARTEKARVEADASLATHIRGLSDHARELGIGTKELVAALKAPTSRGQWGEVQLRRIVEAAGMLEHTDFDTQHRGRNISGDQGQRPDLVVHLSQGRTIVVDAKAPMDSYLRAMQNTEPQHREQLLRDHAKALRSHVNQLSSKAYWAALGDSPEFVVLFVPSDGVLAAALEADPALLDGAFMLDVVIASPATLMALLRTVAHTWRTDALNQDALKVLEAGREVHKRLGTLGGHMAKLGRSLEGSVKSFNETVGSFQSRVIPAVRAMEELQVVGQPLPEIEPITTASRDTAFLEAEITADSPESTIKKHSA